MIVKCGDHAIDHLLAIRWRERTPQPGTRRGGSAENAIVSGHRPPRLERLPAAALASPTLTGLHPRSGQRTPECNDASDGALADSVEGDSEQRNEHAVAIRPGLGRKPLIVAGDAGAGGRVP
jgi:hypothetical protein